MKGGGDLAKCPYQKNLFFKERNWENHFTRKLTKTAPLISLISTG